MPTPEARAARNGARTVLLASLANILFTVLALGIFVVRADDAIAKVKLERQQRSQQSCLQYNRDQTRNRDFNLELVPSLAKNFFDSTAEEVAQLVLSPGYSAYREFIVEKFPYRQCTPECVEAYVRKDLADCKPASNEAGDA